MAYNENLAERIRQTLFEKGITQVEEKAMMGGLSFMVNEKMCVGIVKDDLMCRIDPAAYEAALEENGCRPMDFTGKPMKGWIFIDETGYKNQKAFEGWIDLALSFNAEAKASKKKKK